MLSGFLDTAAIILVPIWQIIKAWWWLVLPVLLWKPFTFLWLWWRNELWYAKQRSILLEIKIPQEVPKPIKAMEQVMAGFHQTVYKPPDWWEKWIDGEVQPSYSFEIVSIGGEIHFFIRVTEFAKDPIEAIIYSQYPDAEISVAEDYTKHVPQDIPNKEWNLWGTEYKFTKADPYPIKTYKDFETEGETKDERQVDPLAALLEAMGKLKPQEQLWVQFITKPVGNTEIPWVDEGKELRDKLARRVSSDPKKKPLLLEAADILITGEPSKKPEEKQELIPVEMKLTPGEREIIAAVENKIAKQGFQSTVRFIYMGHRDVYFQPNLRLVFGYFAGYATQHTNSLVPYGQPLMTKIKKSWFLPANLFRGRRLFLRKRKLFRRYISRLPPFYPRRGGTLILNIEEMASLFHFPGRGSAPSPFLARVETKKGEAPPGLPTE